MGQECGSVLVGGSGFELSLNITVDRDGGWRVSPVVLSHMTAEFRLASVGPFPRAPAMGRLQNPSYHEVGWLSLEQGAQWTKPEVAAPFIYF